MATPSLMLSQVTCTACNKTFCEPLLLPCQHTFCTNCIVSIPQDDDNKTSACPKCGVHCRLDECQTDSTTLSVMELYNSCTSEKKQTSSKLKIHLPSRLLGGSKKEKKQTLESAPEVKKAENGATVRPSDSLLRAGNHASVCSVIDADTVLCVICMKHGAKWMCMKCAHKTCDICRTNGLLFCKDQTKEHTFVEYDNSPMVVDFSEPATAILPPKKPHRMKDGTYKNVTFEGIENLTESSTDNDLPKPNYRDSLALTKDKKQRLEDITKELKEMERVGESRCEALSGYHDYMTEVKVAGFDLLAQTEMVLHDKIKAFFVKIRKDYEQGFDEMTQATEDIHQKMSDNLQTIQLNSAILEEIVENNDTRAMMDQEFLDGKCDEVERSVVELAQNIVQCNSAGLQKTTQEWGTEERTEFEKSMNCNILTAVDEEMEKTLYKEMRAVVGGDDRKTPKCMDVTDLTEASGSVRESKRMFGKDKRRWYDCVLS